MTILELKLTQYLARVDQDPLFLVLIDLQKAYETVDRGFLLKTLGRDMVPSPICAISWQCFLTDSRSSPAKTGTSAHTSKQMGGLLRADSS